MENTTVFMTVDILIFSGMSNHIHAYVCTVVSNSLIVGKRLDKWECSIHRALTFLQAFNVALLEQFFDDIHNLLKRLNAIGNSNVVFLKRTQCFADTFADSVAEGFQFLKGGIVNNNGVVYLLSGIFSFFNEVVICFPKKFFLNLFSISFEKNIIYLFFV